MKKAILATVLMVCISFSAIAQKNHKNQQKHQKPQFTIEQQTTLAVKKLTLAIDLTPAQQEKMYPLLLEANTKKKEMMESMKANKQNGTKPSNDEIYAKMIEKLDYQIAFQGKVKKILKSDQYEKWHEMKSKMHKKSSEKRNSSKKGKPKGKKANS